MSEIKSVSDLDDMGRKIVGAFLGEEDRLRTIGGVARETGVDPKEINKFVNKHIELFRESGLTPSGTKIFVLDPKFENIRIELETPFKFEPPGFDLGGL